MPETKITPEMLREGANHCIGDCAKHHRLAAAEIERLQQHEWNYRRMCAAVRDIRSRLAQAQEALEYVGKMANAAYEDARDAGYDDGFFSGAEVADRMRRYAREALAALRGEGGKNVDSSTP